MRNTLAALSVAAGLATGLGLICCPSANAFPIGASAIGQSATSASAVQKAQYAERRGRRAITKCYRDFVIGRYRCHTYRYW